MALQLALKMHLGIHQAFTLVALAIYLVGRDIRLVNAIFPSHFPSPRSGHQTIPHLMCNITILIYNNYPSQLLLALMLLTTLLKRGEMCLSLLNLYIRL